MSEALSEGTRKRISRINRRATTEVQAAFTKGLISARRADTLLYLPPRQQRKKLQELLTESSDRERRYRKAATAIEHYLEIRIGPVDLQEVAKEIRTAVM